MKTIIYISLVILFFSATTQVNSTDPISILEISQLNKIVDMESSIDGKYVAYIAESYNKESDTTSSFIKLVNSSDKDEFDLTTKQADKEIRESNLVFANFSKDDHTYPYIFFLRNGVITYRSVSEKSEDLKTIALPVPVSSFKIKNGVIAFTAYVYPEFGSNLELTKARDADMKSSNTYYVYEKLPVREFYTFNVGKITQLFTAILSLNSNNTGVEITSQPVNRLNNNNNNANGEVLLLEPKVNGENNFNYDLKPDGTELVVSAIVDNLGDLVNTKKNDVIENFKNWVSYTIDITDNKDINKRIKLDFSQISKTSSPSYSPSGDSILFLSYNEASRVSSYSSFTLYSNGVVSRFNYPDFSIQSFTWFNDYIVLFNTTHNGFVKLGYFRLDVNTNEDHYILLHDEANNSLSTHDKIIKINNTYTVLTIRSGFKKTPEIYSFIITLFKDKEYPTYSLFTNTSINDATFNDRILSKVESVEFTSNNIKIKGFLLYPIDFDETKSYPLVTYIHGGAEYAFVNIFNFSIYNSALLSKNTNIVFLSNPYGSLGYGQQFSNDIRGNFDAAAKQVIDGVASLKNRAYINYNNKCLMGLSLGGYFTNYLRGKIMESQDIRFNCYISQSGGFYPRMSIYSANNPFLLQELFCDSKTPNCLPYSEESSSLFDKFNPESMIGSWDKAPQLVIHAQSDFIFTWSEGNSLFTALQMKGIESKYLFFKKESHFITRPQNIIKMDEVMTDFINTHISKDIPKSE